MKYSESEKTLIKYGVQFADLVMEIQTKIDDDEKFLEFMVKTNKYFTNIIRRVQMKSNILKFDYVLVAKSTQKIIDLFDEIERDFKKTDMDYALYLDIVMELIEEKQADILGERGVRK